jgi:hypothetical protein
LPNPTQANINLMQANTNPIQANIDYPAANNNSLKVELEQLHRKYGSLLERHQALLKQSKSPKERTV